MTAVRALRRQPKVAVIGSGSWGTSVASIIARHSPTVIWGRSAEVVDQINSGHTNERYLPGYALTPSLTATTDLARAVEPADILIMAVPSHGFRGALDDLLRRHPDIDAVFCSSDLLALGVLTEARSRGLAVPGHLAVVGFGDLEFAADLDPALTTVHINGAAIGRRAAQFIVDRAEGRDVGPRVVDIGFSVVERASS